MENPNTDVSNDRSMNLLASTSVKRYNSTRKKLGGKKPDRYIPRLTSQKAYKASKSIKSLDLNNIEVLERSSSPARLSSPEFFHDLRNTGHYQAVRMSTPNTTVPSSTEVGNSSSNKMVKNNPEEKRYREFIADSLGFLSPDRVYVFTNNSDDQSLNSNELPSNSSPLFYNPLKVDTLITTLPQNKGMSYLATSSSRMAKSQSSFDSFSTPRPTKRIKSHIPYRVLDAPCLRNDFYSNLVSWSKTTNNVIVGLGCSVYIWSDSQGAIPIIEHEYLHRLHDLVTCVSFCPKNSLFIVGTKKGRLLLFDQETCIENFRKMASPDKPLFEYQSPTMRGISCIEWYLDSYETKFIIGEESGDVTILKIAKFLKHNETGASSFFVDSNSPNSIINFDNSNESRTYQKKKDPLWKLDYVNKFQAQTQQVCGISLNEKSNILAVGGNDNSCTVWSLENIKTPILLHTLTHKAAVKAVAFCPWSKSLLATGGGSKDRCIKFWHAKTGTLLGEIITSGQITALIWSTRYKQIVATFGFGEIENPVLVTLYSYPKLEPILHVNSPVPFRVLSAVASPNFTSICVATNDETIRFYELWNDKESTINEAQESGLFGSNIIEYVEGINTNNDLIR